jgi:hypothetical protein
VPDTAGRVVTVEAGGLGADGPRRCLRHSVEQIIGIYVVVQHLLLISAGLRTDRFEAESVASEAGSAGYESKPSSLQRKNTGFRQDATCAQAFATCTNVAHRATAFLCRAARCQIFNTLLNKAASSAFGAAPYKLSVTLSFL